MTTRPWLMAMLAPGAWRCALPHHRHEAMTYTLSVSRVARQIPRQDSLLVEEPPEQKRRHRGECEEAPVRAECERRAEHVERSARVHRMAHDGVRSCRDD